jgi:molecular chaperone GrpE
MSKSPADQASNDDSHDDVQSLKGKVMKLTDVAARSQADLQNFKARIEKESKELAKFSSAPLLLSLLPIFDDLQRAKDHSGDKQGLSQVIAKFEKVLTDAGLKRIQSVGEKTDPTKHEVLATAPGEKDVVLEVHEEGYEFHEKVLRPAKVVVGNGA